MQKVLIGIVIALVLIIAGIVSYHLVITKAKNNLINELQELNIDLTIRIANADAAIETQNNKIEQYKVDMALAEEEYNKKVLDINARYDKLKQETSANKSCDEILAIINNRQKEFMSN